MGDSTRQIEREIASARGQLEDNIEELKSRVVDAADWKKQFERNTWVALGMAFGGGLVISALVRPSARTVYPARTVPGDYKPSAIADVWDGVKAAATSFAGAKLIEVVNEAVPGFADHYQKSR